MQPQEHTGQCEAPPPVEKRAIVLVGLMGAGKSTVGRRLASALGLPFYDAPAGRLFKVDVTQPLH